MQVTNLKTHHALWDEFDLNPSAAIFQENDAPRLVVDQRGDLLFANNAFLALANLDFIEATTLKDFFAAPDAMQVISAGNPVVYNYNNFSTEFTVDAFTTSKRDKVFILSTTKLNTAEKLHHYVSAVIDEKNMTPPSSALFIDLIQDACVICRPNGSIVEANNAFEKFFIGAQQDAGFANIFDYISSDYIKEFKEKFLSDTPDQTVKTYHRRHGHKWLEWRFSYVENNIYVTARDISEREKSKTELAIQQVRLKEAEAIGHFGQWEWHIGQDDIIFSEQLFKIFGLNPDTAQPTLDSINEMIHEDDKDRMMQVFQRAIIECNNYDMDFCIETETGDMRYIRCEGRCKTDEDDDVYALYGIMQDVTDTMTREQDLLNAKESVERAYAAKTQFLANMSHELRTPLNAVIGFSEMMERQLLGPLGNDKYLEYISGIRKSGEHLLDLISDILDMSKIEAGKYDLHLEKFNLAKTARLAVHMIEGRAVNNSIKLDVQIDEEELPFIGDRRAIMQVILNLLSNSVKFSKDNGTVTLSIEKTNDEFVSIKVIDHGIGIPANKLVTITQPFEQVESHYTREYEGTGLGLSITKELVQLHEGSLDIQSRVNEGTTVSIILPIKTDK